eukprot:6490355-Amphidinium_carterae.2
MATNVAVGTNGDWQNLDQIEYYKESGDTRSKEEIAQVLETGLACALLHHKPPVYVRSRWTGLDLCVDSLMRIECIHGLMTESYKVFMKMHEQPQSKPVAGNTTRTEAWSGTMRPDMLEHDDHEQVVPCEGQMQGAILSASENMVHMEQHRSAEDHSKDRKKAMKFWSGRPFGKMVILRISLQPILGLLHDQFRTCSEDFELQESAKLAEALLQGQDIVGIGREYMLTLAANGTLEKRFLDMLMVCFTELSPYNILPQSDLNVSMNALAMKLLCRLGAMVEDQLASIHRTCPFSIFRMLSGEPGVYEEIAARPACVLDRWTRGLLERFDDATDPLLLETLLLHCQTCSTCTADIEARHAANRRVLTSRSVQTWGLMAATTFAEWYAMNMRRAVAASKLSPKGCSMHRQRKRKV